MKPGNVVLWFHQPCGPLLLDRKQAESLVGSQESHAFVIGLLSSIPAPRRPPHQTPKSTHVHKHGHKTKVKEDMASGD